MKIAHVTATFPPYRGGTGTVCYNNARELVKRGHDVHVFTAAVAEAPDAETREGISIHRLRPLVQVGNAPMMPQLFSHLNGFDIIHLHFPFYGGESATLAARWRRTPLIITYHQDVHQTGWLGVTVTILRETLGRWTLRCAKKVLFTSADYGRASYVQPMLKGREAAIGELANGVDTDYFCPGEPATELRVHYGLASEDQIVLLVAALDRAHYFKGVDVLLQALAALPPHVKTVIVGDGDLRAHYAAQATELGIDDRVMFAGRVSDTSLVDHYRLADVTVLPSITMGEAFGMVLVESLACGTPVIASALPGVRTVVDEGVDGFLVQPGSVEALERYLHAMLALTAEQRAAMGLAGRRKVEERYALEQIGARLEAIYCDVLRQPSGMNTTVPGAAQERMGENR
jgi:glycosyltransferase involved in cell wall biosynthesis